MSYANHQFTRTALIEIRILCIEKFVLDGMHLPYLGEKIFAVFERRSKEIQTVFRYSCTHIKYFDKF